MRKIWKNYLTEDEFKVLLFLVFIFGLGMIIEFTGFLPEQPAPSIVNTDFTNDYEIKYDLRNVTNDELITIPGIGAKKAEDILNYRESNGFNSKIDLLNVKGIGKTTLSKIEKYFLDFGVEFKLTTEAESKISGNVKTISNKEIVSINLNEASLEELVKLPGIGPSKAEKILNLRKQLGKFSTVEDLLQVKGIGLKTLEKFKDQVFIGGFNE